MRWIVIAGLVACGLAVSAGAAEAPRKVAGTYSARFEEVANNCPGIGMSLGTADVALFEPRERQLQVTIPSVPLMKGVVSNGGKFKADAKRGKTATAGVEGRFSIAGRVDDKGVQFLFIAEYFKGTQPLCTQSWNGSGPRK